MIILVHTILTIIMTPFLIIFTIFFIITLIIGGVIYLIYIPFKIYLKKKKWLNQKRNRIINYSYLFLLFVIPAYITYNAFYPVKEFYIEEFKSVTHLDFPNSGKFVYKKASYPDFQGDYFSSSQIKLSQNDYKELYKKISLDSNMVKTEIISRFKEFDDIKNKSELEIINGFTRKTAENDLHCYIGFCNDSQTIFVNVIQS